MIDEDDLPTIDDVTELQMLAAPAGLRACYCICTSSEAYANLQAEGADVIFTDPVLLLVLCRVQERAVKTRELVGKSRRQILPYGIGDAFLTRLDDAENYVGLAYTDEEVDGYRTEIHAMFKAPT